MNDTLQTLEFALEELLVAYRASRKEFQATYRAYSEAKYRTERLGMAVDSMEELIRGVKDKHA